MKSKEELNDLKKEVEALNKKLADLNEEELKQITGGDVLFDLDTQHKYELPDDHWGEWQSE